MNYGNLHACEADCGTITPVSERRDAKTTILTINEMLEAALSRATIIDEKINGPLPTICASQANEQRDIRCMLDALDDTARKVEELSTILARINESLG